MKAYKMMTAGKGEVVDIPKPEPRKGEVRIRTAWAGICGSDLHAYHGHHVRRVLPLVPGHEISGWIDAMGPDAGDLAPDLVHGTPVVIYPEQGCGACDVCARGWTNLCASKSLLGTEKWPGGFAQYICAPAGNVVALPDGIDMRLGALAEPVAVAIHAMNRATLKKGDSILIFGFGCIGAVMAVVARHFGCEHITVCDIVESKLEVALALGADAAINSATAPVKDQMRARGLPDPDMVFIAASPSSLVGESFAIAKPRGTIVLVGQFNKPGVIDIDKSRIKEQTIVGSFTYGIEDIRAAVSFLGDASAELLRTVTEEITLDDAEKTIDALSSMRKEAVKILIRTN